MNLSHDDVQEILKIIDASSVEELHLEIGDFKLTVRKRGAGSPASGTGGAGVDAVADVTRASSLAEGASRPEPGPPPPGSPPARSDGVEVKAPMVGTFYGAPAPGAPPFVVVGTVVAEDDTVCIIEVMKLMNSIRAGCRGRVAEILAEDGGLVEFGQTLMVIEPLP